MSKDEKKAKDTKATKDTKSNLPERPTYKYNVQTLAEKLGIETASVRVALRKHKIEKAEGGVYGWDTKADFEEVLAQLKAKPEKKAAKKDEKPAKGKDEKPAKKAKKEDDEG